MSGVHVSIELFETNTQVDYFLLQKIIQNAGNDEEIILMKVGIVKRIILDGLNLEKEAIELKEKLNSFMNMMG